MVKTEIQKQVKNKSLYFMLPLLGLVNDNNIENTYLGSILDGEIFTGKIYILCNSKNEEIESNINFESVKEVSKGILYKLNFPEQFNPEYRLFLLGKYSKFGKEAKNILCKKASKGTAKEPHETNMYGIVHRTTAKKKELEEKLDVKLAWDAEYASIMNEELEIYGE